MQRERPISTLEGVTIAAGVIFGSWSIRFWGDWRELTYIHSQWIFVPANFALSTVLFWLGGTFAGVPRVMRLPAALRGAIAWNLIFLSLIPYVGFVFLLVEIIGAGLLFAFRSSLTTWKAVVISGIVRAIVLIILQPKYLMDM